jgi:hypothetical protein
MVGIDGNKAYAPSSNGRATAAVASFSASDSNTGATSGTTANGVQAKAAVDGTAKAVGKAAARAKRKADQCDPIATIAKEEEDNGDNVEMEVDGSKSTMRRHTRKRISLRPRDDKENQEENTFIGGVSRFQ